MALETYRKKRNFGRSPEPKGDPKPKAKTEAGPGNSFVIQKHDARRLHYDFRLEMDGVLKSWAVTKGPSLVAGEKRLAVHVEDHPLDYGDFEGTIPKGEYGGGTVIVWDRGTWRPIGEAHAGYRKGHLDFELSGEKLHGRWHLVRMASKPREKHENWLLIKGDDEFARPAAAPDILDERPESAKTGRMVDDVAGEAPGWSSKTGRIERDDDAAADAGAAPIKAGRKRKFPGFVAPMLATLRAEAPAGDRWLHEIKFDGYRIQAEIDAGSVKLVTRSGLDWTDRFGASVPKALGALNLGSAILDGELVVEAGGGASQFSALQEDLSEGRTDRFVYYAFDLPYLDGHDLRDVPLVDRKAALERLLDGAAPALRYSAHFDESGEMVFRHACRLGLEGVVSKLRDGKYRSGRNRDWIKSKCGERQEFVVSGYVPSTTSDRAIGSLVLGYYRQGDLIHAGRVGTGFSRVVAEDLFRRLQPLRRDASPFAAKLDAPARHGAVFVEPKLVAEVEFGNWTGDGLLRHAAFRGLREDKPAAEVVREGGPKAEPAAVTRSTVKLTHPDRVYWEDAGVTKQGLADYYAQVWTRMAPTVVARPLALVRCPDGATGQCFFQKHRWRGQSGEILTFHDPHDKSDEPMLAIDRLDGLIGLVQGGVLEIHTWQSTLADLERPDQIVMDLDPGEGVGWDALIEAAREVRARLAEAKLQSFVKTSGGKGLHVVAPLIPAAGWEEVKAFTRGIADAMANDDPGRYVATITKSKRGGKILVDYLRNGRGATAVAPYSTRARAGATVSMPLAWDELDASIGPAHFTVENAPARIANLRSDPWADFRAQAAKLPGRGRGKSGRRSKVA